MTRVRRREDEGGGVLIPLLTTAENEMTDRVAWYRFVEYVEPVLLRQPRIFVFHVWV